MQPRRERLGDRGETVFQVTKRGDSVMEVRRCCVRRGLTPMGVKGSGVVAVVESAREADDDEEGVELLDLTKR